jgi:hypothetical protein
MYEDADIFMLFPVINLKAMSAEIAVSPEWVVACYGVACFMPPCH